MYLGPAVGLSRIISYNEQNKGRDVNGENKSDNSR